MHTLLNWAGRTLLWLILLLPLGPPAAFAAVEDLLLERGLISKEDWVKLKAEQEYGQEEQVQRLDDEFPIRLGYGGKGLEFSTKDGKYKTQIQWRLQFRYSYPEDSDPRVAKDFDDVQESSFNIRRARIKVGGHGYQPWLKYYFEYDWPSSNLLDWRVMVEKYKWLQLRIGQWKINYNRERVDSSGKQQFVERSIVNREFTIDRQQGAMLYGHLFPGTPADMWYYAGVFSGTGRGNPRNDDNNMMYMGRLQWNFLGRDLGFSQSDVEYTLRPTGSIAWAGVTNISNCTRFSSSGCGNLDGFPSPSAAGLGRFRLDQMMEEFAFKWRGFSVQHEFHWKQVKDTINQTKTNLMGSYSQVGYFFHNLLPIVPKPLETAFRFAFVDENVHIPDDVRREYTLVFNWFFAGHANKLTLDLSHLTNEDPTIAGTQTEERIRLQWDISF